MPFYREIAARVLEYEDKQDELLALLREMTEQGLSPILLNDRDSHNQMIALEEIDPFTFFASWNRGSKDSSRRAICQFLKEQWELSSEVPDDFDGIPTVNPQSSWFFAYLRTREPHDIKALWRLASAAVKNELDKITPEEWNQALRINQVGVAKLTMGLFWIEPEKFLTLDAHTVNYVRKAGVEIEKSDLDKKKLTIERYGEILSEIHNVLGNDNLKISLDAYGSELEAESKEELSPAFALSPKFPLNQILYGPPGTGKTYSTIERAVEIIDGVAAPSHGEAKARFDELCASGQIAFVTFHQSFSYEEFVEGLRPILDEDGDGTARYEVRDGVLKKLALRAADAVPKLKKTRRLTFAQVWRVFLERLLENDIFYGLGGKAQYKVDLIGNHIVGKNMTGRGHRDYKVPQTTIEKIWSVLQPEQRPETKTIRKIYGDGIPKAFDCNLGGAILQELQLIEKELLNPSKPKLDFDNAPRYVLIVDEINRGNISKILGELITLLEPDKRIGAENELRVQLPVSGDPFALPPNLYLLGTMNTADKSLALLDVALRRRFDFIEMAPDNSLFPDFAREVLMQLNWRLEVALDREHRIGHAVFINCDESEFSAVFRAKIIPLLQEFFYNDWETLRAVLGEGGDKNGAFVKKLEAPPGMKARTKWRWWFDEDGAGKLDIMAALRMNYGV